MKNAADKYNYKAEAYLALLLALVFLVTVGFGFGEPIMPLLIVHPKEYKKKKKEDEQNVADSILFVKVTPDWPVIKRKLTGKDQRMMIARWARKQLADNPNAELSLEYPW